MGKAEHRHRIEAGISKNDFIGTFRCRVTIKERLHIRSQKFANLGNLPQKSQRNTLCFRPGCVQCLLVELHAITQGNGNLLVEAKGDILNHHRQIVADIIDAVMRVFDITGIGHSRELPNQFIDDLGIRLVEYIQLVDMTFFIVIG